MQSSASMTIPLPANYTDFYITGIFWLIGGYHWNYLRMNVDGTWYSNQVYQTGGGWNVCWGDWVDRYSFAIPTF
jgi:hypothetical protein